MLYLNDLVENGVLVKKSGATAIAATGKTAGFAANEFDRVRMAWTASRSYFHACQKPKQEFIMFFT